MGPELSALAAVWGLSAGALAVGLTGAALTRWVRARVRDRGVAHGRRVVAAWAARAGLPAAPDVDAQYRGFGLRVVARPDATAIVVSGGGLPRSLSFHRGTSLVVQTGDTAFDQRVTVFDEDRLTRLARLDPERRAALRLVAQQGLRLERGVLTLSRPFADPDALGAAVDHCLTVAGRLAEPIAPGALAARLCRDPEPGVRAFTLEVLLGATDRGEPVPDALLELLAAPDRPPEVRLRAARGLGHAGRGHLRRLMDEPSVATEAAFALAERVGPGEEPALEERLVALVPTAAGPPAVLALERVGTVRAVPALRALAGLGLTEAGRSAQRAIAAIQRRAAPNRGGLAVVEVSGPAGAVALTDDLSGGVSAPAPAPRPRTPQ